MINIKIYHLILLLVVTGSDVNGCDILESMSCQCYSSPTNQTEQLKCTNYHTPINGSIKLTNSGLLSRRTFDSFHLTFHTREFNITPMFINELSYLFARQQPQRSIQITLTFQDYTLLSFHDYAFYQIFGEKSDQKTSLSIELTASGQLDFAPMTFFQLNVDRFSLHSSSLEPYSFEQLFNNTNIESLTIEGCTPRINSTLQTHFTGKIQSLKVIKMAELISSDEFPSYPVRSLTIEVHEPRRINATTFMNYQNLFGIHLIRPRFFVDQRSFDGFQYLPNLETIEIDAETIKDNAFEHVRRVRYFTLGNNVRYLSENSFSHLDFLSSFDLSKVLVDQLYPTAKCVLARYVEKQQRVNPSITILPPQADFCDCVYDFILSVSKRKADKTYTNLCQSTQQERCQLNECDVIQRHRFISNQEESQGSAIIPSIDDSALDEPVHYYAYDPHDSETLPPPPPPTVRSTTSTTTTTITTTTTTTTTTMTTTTTTTATQRPTRRTATKRTQSPIRHQSFDQKHVKPSRNDNSYHYRVPEVTPSTTTTTTTTTVQPPIQYPSVNEYYDQARNHYYQHYNHQSESETTTSTRQPAARYPSADDHYDAARNHYYNYYHHEPESTTTTMQPVFRYPSVNDNYHDRQNHYYPHYYHRDPETTTTTTTESQYRYPSSYGNYGNQHQQYNGHHYYHHQNTGGHIQQVNQYPYNQYDSQLDEYGGSSFAEAQVIVLPAVQPSQQVQSPSSQSYFTERNSMRKGQNSYRNHFGQTPPPYSYKGPHW